MDFMGVKAIRNPYSIRLNVKDVINHLLPYSISLNVKDVINHLLRIGLLFPYHVTLIIIINISVVIIMGDLISTYHHVINSPHVVIIVKHSNFNL